MVITGIYTESKLLINLLGCFCDDILIEKIACRHFGIIPVRNYIYLRVLLALMGINPIFGQWNRRSHAMSLWFMTRYVFDLFVWIHHSDVIMSEMASQIFGVSMVYPIVCSGANKKDKAPCHWLLCGEITGDRWKHRTKGPVTWKIFPFDDRISC